MDLPHFERGTRRAFLRRTLAATGGLTAAGVVLAACSKSDAETFSDTTARATDIAGEVAPSPSAATATTQSASEPSAPASSVSGPTAIDIAFSYTTSESSGRVRNPYIAVWVEDAHGELAALIGVWYSTRNAKYLRELTDFTAVSGSLGADELDAVSGATRSAGRYQLHWDGRGLDGTALAGSHTLWVEAAREHGPHSVTNGPLSLDAVSPTTIAGNGELSDIAVTGA